MLLLLLLSRLRYVIRLRIPIHFTYIFIFYCWCASVFVSLTFQNCNYYLFHICGVEVSVCAWHIAYDYITYNKNDLLLSRKWRVCSFTVKLCCAIPEIGATNLRIWAIAQRIWPIGQTRGIWPIAQRLVNRARVWPIPKGLTKCSAHLGKRAARLPKCAAHLVNPTDSDQMCTQFVKCARIWPIALRIWLNIFRIRPHMQDLCS